MLWAIEHVFCRHLQRKKGWIKSVFEGGVEAIECEQINLQLVAVTQWKAMSYGNFRIRYEFLSGMNLNTIQKGSE